MSQKNQHEWALILAGVIAAVSGAAMFGLTVNNHGGLGFVVGVAITVAGLIVVPRALAVEEVRQLLVGYTIIAVIVIWPIVLITGLMLTPGG
ncbi:MAG TPA: hypothetical protein VHX88_05490 [Solirubrobacteraceae bacterium]|nr:hypothetical protein [Solirubrobacteraceae bacterium]